MSISGVFLLCRRYEGFVVQFTDLAGWYRLMIVGTVKLLNLDILADKMVFLSMG